MINLKEQLASRLKKIPEIRKYFPRHNMRFYICENYIGFTSFLQPDKMIRLFLHSFYDQNL